MEYRKLGRTGLEVGAIGLGTEHLENSRDTIEQVIHTAVDGGVNYIDLLSSDPQRDADFWDNFGPVFRTYRDRLILAVNWGEPIRYFDLDYCQRCFEGILERVGNNYVEVVKLMMVDTGAKWNGWAQDSLQCLRRYQKEGRIGTIGMSSHYAPIAIKAVESGLIAVLMYPLNLTSHIREQDKALIQACVDHGVGLVAMKPYGGGSLFFPKGEVAPATPAQCLHYLFSLPVSTTVPGVKNAEELRAALHYWDATAEERDYTQFLADLHHYLAGDCTYCNHCLPCPQGINVGKTIWLADVGQYYSFDEIEPVYAALPARASECTECGVCMERCPFEVDVVAKMRRAVEVFEATV